MKNPRTLRCIAILTTLIVSTNVMAVESAYNKTDIDNIEVRTLPPARMLEAEMEGKYFDNSSGLFSRLFRYIQAHEISMTVPVEGTLDQAIMRFYVGSDAPSDLDSSNYVRVAETASRQVLSIGGKGSYSESNVRQAIAKLENWLENQTRWQAVGEPYAVYWNGPVTPWFMKRFEVHIPVQTSLHQASASYR